MKDSLSNKKLYIKKSQAVKSTAINTGFSLPNSVIDNTKTIECLFLHKLSDVANFGYLFAGTNVSSPFATSGLYLTSGKLAYSFYWKGSTSGACVINVGQLEDDNWYKVTCNIGTTLSMKMNKMTIVNDEIVVGADILSTTTAIGNETLLGEFGVLSGKYSSCAFNYASGNVMAYLKMWNNSDILSYDFSFCNTGGTKVVNLVNSDLYQLSNVTVNSFWNYTQDFHHRNYLNGFTRYRKTGENDILITNSDNGDQNTTNESGYTVTRVVNGCGDIWNGCESKVKLEDVQTSEEIVVANATNTVLNGTYQRHGDYDGKSYWYDGDLSTYTHFFNWNSTYQVWYWGSTGGTILFYSTDDVAHPYLVGTWNVQNGSLPAGNISISQQDEMYLADKNHIWFDENTGVGKEVKLGTDFTCDGTSTSNQATMIINDINNYDTKSFYIFSEDKILGENTRVLQKIGMGSVIVMDGTNVVYDGNYTVTDYNITF